MRTHALGYALPRLTALVAGLRRVISAMGRRATRGCAGAEMHEPKDSSSGWAVMPWMRLIFGLRWVVPATRIW